MHLVFECTFSAFCKFSVSLNANGLINPHNKLEKYGIAQQLQDDRTAGAADVPAPEMGPTDDVCPALGFPSVCPQFLCNPPAAK
jgi:hypothetical protein